MTPRWSGPPAALITAGRRGDSPHFIPVLDAVRVPPNRAWPAAVQTPDRVLANKAYSSRANRAYLCRRKIAATIPVKVDQKANRRALGSSGGRPPAFDPEVYRQRHGRAHGHGLCNGPLPRGSAAGELVAASGNSVGRTVTFYQKLSGRELHAARCARTRP